MKKQYINIGGKDYAPILVGFGECCRKGLKDLFAPIESDQPF